MLVGLNFIYWDFIGIITSVLKSRKYLCQLKRKVVSEAKQVITFITS